MCEVGTGSIKRRVMAAGLRVLHVDDEPDIREIVQLSLGLDPGLVVHGCGSASEAFAILADWRPHLILLDVMMPIMDGPAMLREMRKVSALADIPVVFLTARTQARDLEYLTSLGAMGVIIKPFDVMTLAATVRIHLKGSSSGLAH